MWMILLPYLAYDLFNVLLRYPAGLHPRAELRQERLDPLLQLLLVNALEEDRIPVMDYQELVLFPDGHCRPYLGWYHDLSLAGYRHHFSRPHPSM